MKTVNRQRVSLALILVVGLALRLYQLHTPLGDWHSFRQADTVSVAREYLKHGLNLLVPRYHDLSNIQSGQENPQGYRMVEFPLIQALVALTYPGGLPLHVYYRLFNLCLSLFSIAFLYLIATRLWSPKIGLTAALVMAVTPFNVYYSRAVLPEASLVLFTLSATYFFILWVNSQRFWHLLLSAILAAFALLTKPIAAFYFPPLLVYLALNQGFKQIFKPHLLIWLGITFTPLWWWRQWILNFPQGIPASDWLFNGNGIRLRPAWFRWLFYHRLTQLILGYVGLIPFCFGLWSLFRRRFTPASAYLSALIFSGLGYLIIIASGNVQHDYYQVILMPLVSLVLALGFQTLARYKIPAILMSLLSLFLSWQQIAGYYHINNWPMVRAGEAVDRLTPKDSLVIAPLQGDTAFLYAANRRGWPIGFHIQEKIAMGAQYYVTLTYDDEARELESLYPTVAKTDEYLLLNLQPQSP